MNKAFEFIRNSWIKAQLAAPPSIQRTVIPRLHEGKEILRLLTKPYLPVSQMQGQGQGGPITATYIGSGYTKPFLKDILFVEKPVDQKAGQIPFWRCHKRADLPASDIVIIETAKHLIHRLPDQDAIIFPQIIHHILDVRGDWQDVKNRFHKSVRYEQRLTRKYGYEYEVSQNDHDFETFYHEMYLPTLRGRYSELAFPMSVNQANHYFKHGLLFFVKRDGQRVCGSVFYLEQDMIHFIIMGVLHGNQQLMKEGAVGALNCLRIEWANQQGYKAVNFLGSGARLNSGLFQHKRKWGTTVTIPPNLHRLIWVNIRRNTPAVAQFLKENPFIVVDPEGKLHGQIIVDDPHSVSAETKHEWEKHYATPGLSSLIIRSASNFAKTSGSVNEQPNLIVPIPLGAGLENRS